MPKIPNTKMTKLAMMAASIACAGPDEVLPVGGMPVGVTKKDPNDPCQAEKIRKAEEKRQRRIRKRGEKSCLHLIQE